MGGLATLGIGVIGAGANTRAKHIPLLKQIPGVDIRVVCNRSRESGETVAAAHGIPEVVTDWHEVINHPAVDAIVIGTWPYLHAPITVAALAAGKHVLCEARMAMNAAEARQMLDASRARPELIAQIVPSPFTLPWDRTIRRLLLECELGKLLHVDVFANCGSFFDPNRSFTWRDDRDLSGLNTMMLGIYYEAMARWTGHARSVRAHARFHAQQRRDADGVQHECRIPDHLDVFGDLECGAGYHIRCSQVTGDCPTPNDFLLYGSKATLRLDLTRGGLFLKTPQQPETPVTVPDREAGSWRVEEEFINAIRGLEPVRHTTLTEGLRYMEFTEAVARDAGFL